MKYTPLPEDEERIDTELSIFLEKLDKQKSMKKVAALRKSEKE